MLLQVLGRPARGADEFGDLGERLRILLQQREIGATPTDRLEEGQAAGEREVRVLGGGGGLEQAWPHRVEALAVGAGSCR